MPTAYCPMFLATNNVLWQPYSTQTKHVLLDGQYTAFAVATGHNKDGATAATTTKFKFNTHFTASYTLYSYICALHAYAMRFANKK